MTVGTVNYAAPEQLMGDNVDGRTDQYALAATAFHWITGTVPFDHANPAVVISRHLNAPPPRLAESRPGLAGVDDVLAKAFAKRPDERFSSCTDFADALAEAALRGTNVHSAPTEAALAKPSKTRPSADDQMVIDAKHQPAPHAWMRARFLVPGVLATLFVCVLAVLVVVVVRNQQPIACRSRPEE